MSTPPTSSEHTTTPQALRAERGRVVRNPARDADGRLPLDPSAQTFRLRPARVVPEYVPPDREVVLDVRMGRPWSLAEFRTPRPPVDLGPLPEVLFPEEYPSVLDCCVKHPGHLDLTIPVPFYPLLSFLQRAGGVFRGMDPAYRARYLYLTVDQRIIPGGGTHRVVGFHVDGLVGPRHGGASFPVCHQILASDTLSTEFAVQPFHLEGLDLATHHCFRAMDRQVNPARVITLPPRHAAWMTGHTVHACRVAEVTTRRTFLRLEASMKPFDRLGNTPNPGLPTPWAWVSRAIPSGLA